MLEPDIDAGEADGVTEAAEEIAEGITAEAVTEEAET
jgi:hypothetical protein